MGFGTSPYGGGTQVDVTAPTIDNFSPAVGTPLARNGTVSFDIKDNNELQTAAVFVTLGDDLFVVFDGVAFRGKFANGSSRVAISGGFRYTIRRSGGWLEAPTFEMLANDVEGNQS